MTETSSVSVEYQRAFAELERRAALGEVTLAQLRREVFELREKFSCGLPVVLHRQPLPH